MCHEALEIIAGLTQLGLRSYYSALHDGTHAVSPTMLWVLSGHMLAFNPIIWGLMQNTPLQVCCSDVLRIQDAQQVQCRKMLLLQ